MNCFNKFRLHEKLLLTIALNKFERSRYKIWSKLDWIVIEITRCNIIKIHIVFVGYTLSLKWLTHTVNTFKFISSDHACCIVIHAIQTNWACRVVSVSYFYQLKLCYPWGILCFSPLSCSFEQQVTERCLISLLMVLKSLMKSLCAFSTQIQCGLKFLL